MAGGVVGPTCVDKQGGTTGERDRLCNPGFQHRKKEASKPLAVKTHGGCSSRRNSQPQQRACWRDQQGPRMYTNPPTQESAPEGPKLLVDSVRSDYKPAESEASSIVPSLTPPPQTVLQGSDLGCLPHKYLTKAPPQPT